MFNLRHGDCLEEMKNIPDGSVDMILTDPPYGIVKSITNVNHGMSGKTGWDTALKLADFWLEINRIIRMNGKIILFSQEPYTSKLINEAHGNLPFNYRMVWLKDHFANSLIAKKAPVSYYEDILIFSKTYDTERRHPLIDYFQLELKKTGLNQSGINNLLGNKMGGHYFTNGIQFCAPTLRNYEKLQLTGFFNKKYEELKKIDNEFKKKYASIFNLPKGKKFKSNVLRYKKDYDGYHPTQKPVALIEDLISTYTHEGEKVLDFTMGSGTTGVACANLKRRFIGIELDGKYFGIAAGRIMDAYYQNV